MSQEEVAQLTGVSTTAYRNWEAGGKMRIGRRGRLAKALKLTPDELAPLLGDTPNGAVPSWLGLLASFEEKSSDIQAFEPLVVHGLLQTEAYATAVEGVGSYTPEQVAKKVSVRMQRQGILDQPDPVRLHVVLDASILRRVAGSTEVMAGQLRHLIDMAARPTVTLQIMPLSAAVFPAAFGSFSLFTSPGGETPYVAGTEDASGPHYLYKDNDIDHHVDLFDHLAASALPPDESVEVIRCECEEHYA